jgi:DNA-binding NarL/FixJ family response regulator
MHPNSKVAVRHFAAGNAFHLWHFYIFLYSTDLSMQPSILLIEDQLLVSQLLQRFLESRYDITTASNTEQATVALAERKFDIALLDLKLDQSANLLGLSLLPLIARNGAKIIVVSAHCSAHAGLACQNSGVVGYVDKIQYEDGLIPAIEMVLAGQQCFSPEWLEAVNSKDLVPLPKVTAVERRVLDLLLEDQTRTNEDMGTLLNLAPDRVRNILTDLFRKFHIKGRYNLVVEARQRGYLPVLRPPTNDKVTR